MNGPEDKERQNDPAPEPDERAESDDEYPPNRDVEREEHAVGPGGT